MSHGGARPGAGRKKGGGAKYKTRKIADRATAEGITPIEVQLFTMRWHFNAERYDEAAKVAHDAAPYCHPRLAAIEHTGKDGGKILISISKEDADLL